MIKKYDVLVEFYDGLLVDVKIMSHEKAERDWYRWAKEHGYKDYEDFLTSLREDDLKEELRWYPDIELEGLTNKEINPSKR